MEPAKKPDTPAASAASDGVAILRDDGEAVSRMEPLLLRVELGGRAELSDLAMRLARASAAFHASLPREVMASLAELVRTMNCYYSNLIEGHNTHPTDIERALKQDYSDDPKKRDLQREAVAHVAVQRWIDEGGVAGRATTVDTIREIHRRFCELLPDDLLWVEDPDTKERVRVVPGVLRSRDVRVGQHVAVSPGAVPRFLTRFDEVYTPLGEFERVLAAAAAHHRLLWIHPFLDGNGRVARLVTHAMLREALDTGALWSVSRGLARRQVRYKGHLAACDEVRRNDYDGRGNLSEACLVDFTKFFLETCLDQVAYMRQVTEPERLRERVLGWAKEEIGVGKLPEAADRILEAVLLRGVLPRKDVPSLLNTSDRSARRVTAALLDAEVLQAESTRAPLRLAFPARLASRWLPGLFPESLEAPV